MVSYGLYKIIASWWKAVSVVFAHEKVGFYSAIAEFHPFSRFQESNAIYVESKMVPVRHGVLWIVSDHKIMVESCCSDNCP